MTENDYCLLYDIASKRNKDLEEENAKLKSELTKKADTNHSLVEQMAKLEEENAELKEQIEKMKCCSNCKSFKGYGETCEGWGEPVLNLNCDCTEWELKEIEK